MLLQNSQTYKILNTNKDYKRSIKAREIYNFFLSELAVLFEKKIEYFKIF